MNTKEVIDIDINECSGRTVLDRYSDYFGRLERLRLKDSEVTRRALILLESAKRIIDHTVIERVQAERQKLEDQFFSKLGVNRADYTFDGTVFRFERETSDGIIHDLVQIQPDQRGLDYVNEPLTLVSRETKNIGMRTLRLMQQNESARVLFETALEKPHIFHDYIHAVMGLEIDPLMLRKFAELFLKDELHFLLSDGTVLSPTNKPNIVYYDRSGAMFVSGDKAYKPVGDDTEMARKYGFFSHRHAGWKDHPDLSRHEKAVERMILQYEYMFKAKSIVSIAYTYDEVMEKEPCFVSHLIEHDLREVFDALKIREYAHTLQNNQLSFIPIDGMGEFGIGQCKDTGYLYTTIDGERFDLQDTEFCAFGETYEQGVRFDDKNTLLRLETLSYDEILNDLSIRFSNGLYLPEMEQEDAVSIFRDKLKLCDASDKETDKAYFDNHVSRLIMIDHTIDDYNLEGGSSIDFINLAFNAYKQFDKDEKTRKTSKRGSTKGSK